MLSKWSCWTPSLIFSISFLLIVARYHIFQFLRHSLYGRFEYKKNFVCSLDSIVKSYTASALVCTLKALWTTTHTACELVKFINLQKLFFILFLLPFHFLYSNCSFCYLCSSAAIMYDAKTTKCGSSKRRCATFSAKKKCMPIIVEYSASTYSSALQMNT